MAVLPRVYAGILFLLLLRECPISQELWTIIILIIQNKLFVDLPGYDYGYHQMIIIWKGNFWAAVEKILKGWRSEHGKENDESRDHSERRV